MNITVLSVILLIIYMLVLRFIGLTAHRLSRKDGEDYFLVGRKVGLVALVGTTMASLCSTGTVVGGPSEFFTKGAGFFWIYFYAMFGLMILLFGIKFWKLGRAKHFITPGDLLGDFYKNTSIRVLAGVLGLLAMIPYSTGQLVAIGKTFESLTDGRVPYFVGVTVACGAIGLYLYFGGGRAVVWSNTFQGFVFSGLVITTGILAVRWAGGWEKMVNNLIANAPEKTTFNVGISYFEKILTCTCVFFIPFIWQRMYMARSARLLAYNFLMIPLIVCGLYFFTWMIATSSIALFPNGLADGDNCLGAILQYKAPVLGAFVLVGVFCAGMSTVDAQMLSAGSLVTRDIMEVIKGRESGLAEFIHGRFFTISLLITIYICSLLVKNYAIMWLIVFGINLTVVFVAPTFGVFYWKRSTTAGAFWSMLLGFIVYFVFGFPPIARQWPFELPATICALVTSVIVFVVVSLLTDGKKINDKREEYAEILR